MNFKSEDKFQQACAEYLAIQENLGKLTYFHVPNGGKRNVREATKFKRMGVRAGVPDLVILFPFFKIIFIELKNGKGTLSKNQIEWHENLNSLGFSVFTIHNWDEFIALIEKFI